MTALPDPARHPLPRLLLFAFAISAATACAGGSRTAGTPSGVASEEEWLVLREPRPAPLEGAPRVTVTSMSFLGAYDFPRVGSVTAELGVAELAVAGLLRRRDVRFVERRRFAAASEAERAGAPRRPGQPAAGVSPSAEFAVNAVWIPLDASRATVEIRLTRLESGAVAGATRASVPPDLDPVGLARTIVAGTLEVLDELGERPAWDDPLGSGANADPSARVSPEAVRSFLMGLAAEEVWDWEGARRGYVSATRDPAFHEARTALARTARLRLGGTLGES